MSEAKKTTTIFNYRIALNNLQIILFDRYVIRIGIILGLSNNLLFLVDFKVKTCFSISI